MIRFFKKINRYVPLFAWIFAAVGVVAAAVYVSALLSSDFANFWSDNISSALRAFMAHLTSFLPFSLAETLLVSSPIILVCLIVYAVRAGIRSNQALVRCVVGMLSILVFVWSVFVFNFGVSYRTDTLDKRLGMNREKVSGEELYETISIVIENLNELVDDVVMVQDEGSIRPYSHEEAVRLCTESYEKLSDSYDFIQKLNAPVKQIMLSEYMTYTHISGVYTFFTGEANLNTNYPYFVNVYTTAHEMAHQRGVAREDEANFIAYLVCIGSDDVFMQYSGYLNMYEYLISALYKASPTLYAKAVRELDLSVRYDLNCYSEFFDKYRENVVADVSDAVNNKYLEVQGSQAGSKSYGMVVDLAVAYYRPLFTQSEVGSE